MTKTKPTKYPPTPELDKMSAVKEESQVIGQFLDWLTNEQGCEICKWSNKSYQGHYDPTYLTIEQRLAEYFEIDLSKIEKERRAVLEYVRSIQPQANPCPSPTTSSQG